MTTTPPQSPDTVKVIQEDIDRATQFSWDHVDGDRLSGEWLIALVKSFARHRLSSSPSGIGADVLRTALAEATEAIGVCIDGFEKSNPTLGGLAAIHMLKEARERYRTILASALTHPKEI